ncbi:MAG TPA: class I SAM-dependent methyltransferase [Vicinamibacterales bacterium]|nr:class I SAM-dependent methyltransferase [Vicinamibacterales bacterium]
MLSAVPPPSTGEVLAGYDALADIYSHVPPLIMWRAWEYAVYRRHQLIGPVLDVGCGDGRFFERVFPAVRDVTGVDHDAAIVELARESGRYTTVHRSEAHQLPFPGGTFQSVFANCSLEHMNRIDDVLAEIHRVLRPGGTLLFSVVTDQFVTRAPLQWALAAAGAPERGRAAQARHEAYHHLVNPFPQAEWLRRVEAAGLQVRTTAPIVNGAAGWVFLLLDQLWHLERQKAGDVGGEIRGWFETAPDRTEALRRVFEGLLLMSAGADDHAGLVVVATR